MRGLLIGLLFRLILNFRSNCLKSVCFEGFKIYFWHVLAFVKKIFEVCKVNSQKQFSIMYITNTRTLKRLAKEGLIEWPVLRHGVKANGKPFSYVDEIDNIGMSFTCSKGNNYRLEYVSGCFLPYVTQL